MKSATVRGLLFKPLPGFVLTLALIGDAVVTFSALRAGFWLRFESGLFQDNVMTELFPQYLDLLIMATVFLLGAFAYLRLYGRSCFAHYSRTVGVIAKGIIFWLAAYLAISAVLIFDPPIPRDFILCSFACLIGAMLAWRLLFFKLASSYCEI